jgi:hypothetical protein
MSRTLVITAAIALALGTARAEPQASTAADRPAAGTTAAAARMSAREDELAGTYTQTRPGVSSIQRLTLVLSPARTCVLTTEFLGGGQRPIIDRGTWSSNGGTVILHLAAAGAQPGQTEIAFELEQGRLAATRWDRNRWGSATLQLERAAGELRRPSAALGQAQAAVSGANAEASADFVGTYKGDRIGPDFREKVTLALKPDRTAAMEVTLVGFPEPPAIAKGTWSSDGRSVTLRLPIQYPKTVIAVPFITFYLGTGHTQTEVIFARTGRELVAIEYDQRVWGTGDLRLRKK